MCTDNSQGKLKSDFYIFWRVKHWIRCAKWQYRKDHLSQKRPATVCCLSPGLQKPSGRPRPQLLAGRGGQQNFECSPQKAQPPRAGKANTWLPSPASVLNYSSHLPTAPNAGGKGDEAASPTMAASVLQPCRLRRPVKPSLWQSPRHPLAVGSRPDIP